MKNRDNDTSLESKLPETPTFSDELLVECRSRNNFITVLFEWYKYVATLCVTLASVSQLSPAIRVMPNLYYAILTGLLNRCARLVLANMGLSVTNKYGETIALLDRCIYESAVIVQWLCTKDNDDCFKRYIADGVKRDLKLKDHIQQSINQRNDKMLVIEEAMLSSINKCINSTGLSEIEIRNMKKLPDLWSMCDDIGLPEKYYLGTQRMGSHSVHGSWTSLWGHYLKQDQSGMYRLRDHDVPPHENQFMMISIIILDTLIKYWTYTVPKADDREPVASILTKTLDSILELIHDIASSDFELA